MKTAERFEDMTPDGRLRLIIDRDNDVLLVAESESSRVAIEFCCHGAGGGSPRTWAALQNLFEAMKADNADSRFQQRAGKE